MPPTLMTLVLLTMMLLMTMLLMPPILLTVIMAQQNSKITIFVEKTQSILQKCPQHQKYIKIYITDAPDGDAKIAAGAYADDSPDTSYGGAGSTDSE